MRVVVALVSLQCDQKCTVTPPVMLRGLLRLSARETGAQIWCCVQPSAVQALCSAAQPATCTTMAAVAAEPAVKKAKTEYSHTREVCASQDCATRGRLGRVGGVTALGG
jgi:hypothetical protein